ncbi:MAG: hypothetical protein WD042_02640 [Phycisphaeraceae bacterium]
MLHRRFLQGTFVLFALLGILLLAADPAAAQDTAQDLYQQGMTSYQAGELEAARETLRRVDPVQLSKEDRVVYYQTLQEIDRRTQTAAAPATTLEQAQAAYKAGQAAKAIALYQTVQDNPQASTQDKATATARVAEIKRNLSARETTLRQTLDRGIESLGAGQLDSAEADLTAVKASGIDLGWWDNQRLERGLQVVGDRRAAAGQMAAAATPEAPAAPTVEPGEAMPTNRTETPVAAVEPAAPEPAAVTPEPAAAQAEPAPAGNDLMGQAMALYAQQKLAEGRDAEAQGNTRVAANAYEDGLRFDPNNAELQTALQNVRAKMDAGPAPQQILDVDIAQRQVLWQAAEAEYHAAMDRARTQLTANNFDAAASSVEEAKRSIDARQTIAPPTRYNELRAQATNLSAQIDTDKIAFDSKVRLEDARTTAQREGQERIRIEREQDQQIQRLLRRAADLRREQKYAESLSYLNQALFLDPTNVAAQAMKEMIEDSMIYVDYRRHERQRALQVARGSVDNLEATIPYTELLSYPSDWPALTYRRWDDLGRPDLWAGRRRLAGGESDANLRVAQRLKEPIPITFEGNRLVNVIDYFRNTTGLAFDVNWSSLETAGIEQDKQITLNLPQIPADVALTRVLRQASSGAPEPITYSIVDGIVTISTERDLNRETDTRVYDIRDMLFNVPNFGNVPDFDLSTALSNTGNSAGGSGTSGGGGGGGGGGGLFGGAGGAGAAALTPTETLSREEMVNRIRDLITSGVGRPEEWTVEQTSTLNELNGNLIVKTNTQNHRQIVQLLSQLRETRAMQISVEARFLLVDQNFLEEVGVDLDIQQDLGGNFGPVQIANDTINLAARPSTALAGSFGLPQSGPISAFVPGLGFTPSGRSIDVGFSYFDDLQVNLLLRATLAKRNSISLNAPRVTFFNGQRAHVVVARQVVFISDLEPIPDALGFDPTLSVVQSGVVMIVEGTISADRRYVTLTVQPSLATLAQPIRRIEQLATGTVGNGNNAQTVAFAGFVEAPEIELTQVKTTVSVPDRGTLLLGGQRLVGDVQVEAGVPVLSRIPLISRFFTNTSNVKDERTLLILIKPTIIIQNEQEEELFPGLLQDPARYNIGRNIVPPMGGP